MAKQTKTVFELADAAKRHYITPEDVTAALESGATAESVRLNVLQVIGKMSKYGIEDSSLCAFNAASDSSESSK
jgi:hypothetical protein